MEIFIFLLFSCLAGFIELGSLIFALQNSYTIYEVLLLALAFQVGYFFPNEIEISKKLLIPLTFLCLCLYLSTIFVSNNYIILLFATLLVSICIQTVRGKQKGNVSTALKRSSRILGFALSFMFTLPIVSILCCIVLFFIIISNNNFITRIHFEKLKFHQLIMIAHQMHYFSYSYFILIILMLLGGYQGIFASCIFVLGWIPYTLIPIILRKNSYILYFIVGHVFLVLVLLIMSFTTNINLRIFLWIITGFGGGTVFCIEKILKRYNDFNKAALTFSENIGHVLGIASGIGIYLIFKSTNIVIISASIFAAITVVLMIIYLKSKGTLKIQENDKS